MKGIKINGAVVACNFIFCRILPCKERAHPSFDFKGQMDFTQERIEVLTKDDILERAAELFAAVSPYTFDGQHRVYVCSNLPPAVRISFCHARSFMYHALAC